MKNLTTIIDDLSFIRHANNSCGPTIAINKKKSFMIETLHEVGERLSSLTRYGNDTAKELNDLKREFKKISKEKHNAVENLRNVQTRLKSISKTSEHLRLKQSEIKEGIKETIRVKKELEEKVPGFKEEDLLDIELVNFRKSLAVIEDKRPAFLKKLTALENDYRSLTAFKKDLNNESKSVTGIIKVFQTKVPELRSKKENMEKQIQSIEKVRTKYKEAEKEQNSLSKEMKDIFLQRKNSKQELDNLKNKHTVLRDQFIKCHHEKERLENEIEKLIARKERVENLNKTLETAAKEKNEYLQILQKYEAKLKITSKGSGELNKDIESIKQKITDLRQERINLEEVHKPIVTILEKAKSIKNQCGKEQARCKQLSDLTVEVERDIRVIEAELHYYKNALKKIGQLFDGGIHNEA